MEPERLAEVVTRIANAVEEIGLGDRATWLRVRASSLLSGDVDRAASAKHELGNVVHGMGGLLDLRFGANREEVHGLIDQLWTAVKP